MKPVRVMTIFGTRPEAVKMAPLVAELQGRETIEALCCVTAQHRQMLDSVLEIFHLRPDFDLDIMEPRQTLSTITTKCLLGMEGVLEYAKHHQATDRILEHIEILQSDAERERFLNLLGLSREYEKEREHPYRRSR